ncbi:MAG: nucleotidyltransferase family protein [Deltaproteobacteria bacterium]|nr:nucleotidyltransferase family protein [Deltaproteobacteria bacterium]
MTRQEVIDILSLHREAIARFRVRSIGLFGSVARDDSLPRSDVDILVEFEGPATFDVYMDLKFFLEDLLKTRVDLVTRRALKSYAKASVDKDYIRVA